jgi:hypothetical protein
MIDKSPGHREIYAIVGELVLISTALDHLLSSLVVQVLELGPSPMVLPVVGTLDPVRKIEILKARADHIAQPDWKKGLRRFVDQTESVFKYRNIACHTPAVLEDGEWSFKPYAAAKMLKKLNLKEKKLEHVSFDELRTAISTAENALGAGSNLIENFKRLSAEKAKRAAAKS